MIKVLNTVPHASVVKEIVCRSCGSLLEYTPFDVEQRKSYDYSGDYDIIKFIKCPTCNREVHVR